MVQALDGVPEEERCKCEHTPVEGKPGVFEVKKREAKVDVGYEA